MLATFLPRAEFNNPLQLYHTEKALLHWETTCLVLSQISWTVITIELQMPSHEMTRLFWGRHL